jgi:polysaccharide export outer membrane protein
VIGAGVALLVASLAGRGAALAEQEYIIGGGDVLQVNVWKNVELSQQVTVRPDGMITLPLVRDVPAGGRTAQALGEQVATRLSAYVNAPNVTVMVVGANSWRVYTSGAVTNGMFPLSAPMTALQLLARAGGPSPDADLSKAYIVRGAGKIPVDLAPRPGGDDSTQAYPETLPGDVLVVPFRDGRQRVLVVGEVRTPRSLAWREGLTVLDAYVEAGGGTEYADLGSVRIARQKTGGAREDVPVDLGRLLKRGGMAGNLALAPGDIVVVPK